MTISLEQQQKIREFLIGKHIPSGLGSKEEACSIAAINLAMTGELTDSIPLCMSPTIGRWIISIQDRMPDELRNSEEWRRLLPLAAGTGRDHEEARIKIILDWMWETALPIVQPIADKGGFGEAWATMLREKTPAAAAAAADAAARYAAAAAADAAARYAAARYADAAARYAADAAARYAAAAAARYAADAAARYAADAAARYAADAAARYAADAAAWTTLDPCALLSKLIAVSEQV